MKIKRITGLLLCIALLTASLAACAGESDDGGEAGTGINYESAYAQFESGAAVLTAGEFSASWDLVYYFICRAIDEIYATTGTMPDLSDESETGYRDQIMTRAAESVMTCLAIEYAAQTAGAVVTDEDRASIALDQELAETQEGGSEAFSEYLANNHASYEVYLYLMGIDRLYENTFTATWGEGASKYTDDNVAVYIAGSDYLMVKHILRSAFAGDGETPLSDEEKQAQMTTLETVLTSLDEYTGDDFDAHFNGLMEVFSEDLSGLNMYPDGYLFTPGQAFAELEKAALELDIGEYSGIIPTEMGYHIVYRVPVSYDVVPQGYAWDARNTLRSQAARDDFGNYVEELRIELGESAAGEFYELDLAKLFK